MLVVRLRLPIRNEESTKNVQHFITDFNLGTVTDEFIHCSMFANGILKCVDKLLGGLHAINSSVERVETNINLTNSRTIIHSRGIRKEGISCNWFIPAGYISCRKDGFIGLFICLMGNMSTPLCSILKSMFDNFSGMPEHVWSEEL